MTLRQRAENYFAIMMMGVFAGLSCLVIYWTLIDNQPPAIHKSVMVMAPDGTVTKKFHRGDTVVLQRESCVHDEGLSYYTRYLIERQQKLMYFMPSGQVRLERGCRKSFNTITIPSFAVPGLYDYVVTVHFINNPLTESTMVLPIPEIEVMP